MQFCRVVKASLTLKSCIFSQSLAFCPDAAIPSTGCPFGVTVPLASFLLTGCSSLTRKKKKQTQHASSEYQQLPLLVKRREVVVSWVKVLQDNSFFKLHFSSPASSSLPSPSYLHCKVQFCVWLYGSQITYFHHLIPKKKSV